MRFSADQGRRHDQQSAVDNMGWDVGRDIPSLGKLWNFPFEKGVLVNFELAVVVEIVSM